MNITPSRNQFRGYEVKSPLKWTPRVRQSVLTDFVLIAHEFIRGRLKVTGWLLIVCMITACTSEEPKKTPVPATTTATATPFVTPELPVDVRLAIEPLYENLWQAYQQMSATWEGLAAGEQSQCGTAYTGLAPEMISGEHNLYQTLRQAAIDLEEAAQLWQAECENPRSNVPQNIIDQGVLHVRAANDKLILIEEALTPQ